MTQIPIVHFSGLTFVHLLVTCVIEIPLLLLNRKKILLSLSTCTCPSMTLVPSFLINFCLAVLFSEQLLNKYDQNLIIYNTFLDTLPLTIVISIMSEVRVFTYYRGTKFVPILLIVVANIATYCIANICIIVTFKCNPNFHNTQTYT